MSLGYVETDTDTEAEAELMFGLEVAEEGAMSRKTGQG
jgi:hypothetical protein